MGCIGGIIKRVIQGWLIAKVIGWFAKRQRNRSA